MTKHYIYVNNGKLNGCGSCLIKSSNINNIEVSEELYNSYILDEDKYIYSGDGEIIPNPEYEKIKEAKEKERLNALSLTSADVERAIYKAKGMDFDDIVEMAKQANEQQAQIKTVSSADDEPVNSKIDIKALKIELKANSFYRGHPFINQIGALLGYSSNDLDYLFENKELPEKEEPTEPTTATEEAGLYNLPAEALDAEADSAED